MKKTIKLGLCAAMLLAATHLHAQNYNEILMNVIKNEFKKDLRGFQFFNTPTDNYGLITTYMKNTDSKNFECDMYSCIGQKAPASGDAAWLTMNGFAAGGDNGRQITLSQDVNDQVGFNLILPKIMKIIGLNGNFNKNTVKHLELTLGSVYIRQLRKSVMQDYLTKLDHSSRQYQLFNSGQMVLIVGDCVIQSMEVDITLADTTSTSIDAKFGWQGSTIAAKILDSASVGVKVAKKSAGHYKFTLQHPVIFARLAKKQAKAGELGLAKDSNFDDWVTVDPGVVLDPDKLPKK
ncbi:hypothetical protein [Mucilaginibacter aquariorum]|uniref:DUF4292 domain-containing protein n=1 Tax=Mucilaginibacter aquariorum TaxID=2967225 RepID=A0ABT1T112_9SPHI|nr:hypothetical protein [Mucilaginibacter aquariorum]MCQ6958286.1 hypothetical protein [Mucilaginibacter aquariorum]